MARLLHVICHYHGQWLPGDERGFRNRGHRIHSSGDYRNPPQKAEHEGLRRWMKQHAKQPVRLSPDQFPVVGGAFLDKMKRLSGGVRCLSCGPTHVHVQYESSSADAKSEIGKAKQFASHQLKSRTGTLWGKGCAIITVRNANHAAESFQYIVAHSRKEGAWVWIDPAMRGADAS